MGSSRKAGGDRCLPQLSAGPVGGVIAVLVAAFVPVGLARADHWRNYLTLYGSEIYSSNINLGVNGSSTAPNSSKSQDSFVTMLMPGISIQHSGHLKFNLNYRAQGLFYEGGDFSTKVNNYLQMNTHGELLKNSLFLSAYSNVSQYNNGSLQNVRYQFDNISQTGQTSSYRTFSLNPYWTPHLGGYVEGTVGVNYTNVSGAGAYNGVNGSNGVIGSSGKSNMVGEYFNLHNGKEYSKIGWRANFFNQDNYTDNTSSSSVASNYSYRNYNGEVRYRWSEHIQPFIQGGNFQNSLGSNTNSVNGVNNGSYWNGGIIWTPSRKTYFQAGYGPQNYFVSLRWNPTRRTDLMVTFRDSHVGGGYGGYGGYGGGYGSSGGYGAGGYGTYAGAYGANGSYDGGGGANGLSGYGSGGSGGSGIGGGMSCGLRGSISSNGVDGSSMGMGGMGGYGGMGMGGMGMGGYGGIGGFSNIGSLGGSGGGYGGAGGFGQLGGFNAGSTWNASFCHRTRLTTWQASYSEYITTSQQILAAQQVFDNGTNSLVFNPINQAALTNETITQKRANVGVGINFSKTNIILSGYQANMIYQSAGNQDVLGLSAAWNWRFAAHTTSQLMFAWQSQDSRTVSQTKTNNDLSMVSLGVYRTITQDMNGGLSYWYAEQTSNNSANQYTENRVMANLFIKF